PKPARLRRHSICRDDIGCTKTRGDQSGFRVVSEAKPQQQVRNVKKPSQGRRTSLLLGGNRTRLQLVHNYDSMIIVEAALLSTQMMSRTSPARAFQISSLKFSLRFQAGSRPGRDLAPPGWRTGDLRVEARWLL